MATRPGHHTTGTTALLLVLLLACSTLQQLHASRLQLDPRPQSEDDFVETFLEWALEYERVYSSFLEQGRRFNIFRDNLLYILGVNDQKGLTYELGLNNFTDVTYTEFQENYLGLNADLELVPSAPAATRFVYADVEPKEAVDWRAEGAVTSVKNQASCGGCWSFATTGAVEGVNKIKRGELIDLSEQQLLDCCHGGQYSICNGCNGGSMRQAYSYIATNGLRTEKNYTYKGSTSYQCMSQASAPVVRIDNVTVVPFDKNVEQNLLKAVTVQPVSVGIDAHNPDIQHYKEGIFNGNCTGPVSHGVLVVGYGKSDDGQKYWILKNSWGASWGEKGYFRLPRETDGQPGKCSINKVAAFPTIKELKESRSSI